jgi:hypothetical protein
MHFENPNIVIVRGDDTDALNNTWEIELETDYNLLNVKAILEIGPLVYEYDDITSKIIPLTISAEDSMKLEEGIENMSIKIIDENGKSVTILKALPVTITSEVVHNG